MLVAVACVCVLRWWVSPSGASKAVRVSACVCVVPVRLRAGVLSLFVCCSSGRRGSCGLGLLLFVCDMSSRLSRTERVRVSPGLMLVVLTCEPVSGSEDC